MYLEQTSFCLLRGLEAIIFPTFASQVVVSCLLLQVFALMAFLHVFCYYTDYKYCQYYNPRAPSIHDAYFGPDFLLTVPPTCKLFSQWGWDHLSRCGFRG